MTRALSFPSLFLVFCVSAALFFSLFPTVYATHESCGNRDGGGGCQNCSCGGGSCSTPIVNPPQPRGICELTVTPASAPKGTESLEVSWIPTASRAGTLSRTGPGDDATFTITTSANAVTDTIGLLDIGNYTYSASYTAKKQVWQPPTCFGNNRDGCGYPNNTGRWILVDVPFTCTAPLTITKPDAPECSDNIDNSDPEDMLIDERDPGCHTDGEPNDIDDPSTYDPNDDDEKNDPPNLKADIEDVADVVEGRLMTVPSTITNTTNIGIGTLSTRHITMRKKNGGGTTVMWSGMGRYLANEVWSRSPRFSAPAAGEYEMCLIADADEEVTETDEEDNSDCIDVRVNQNTDDSDDEVTVDLSIRVAGASGWDPTSVTIDPGDDVELFVEPQNASSCSVVGAPPYFSLESPTNVDQVITVVDEPTSHGSRIYQVRCLGPSGPATDTARVIVRTVTDEPRTNPTLDANPERVRSGGISNLIWNTGGYNGCVISGNGQTIPVGDPAGTVETEEIIAEVTYTLTCEGALPDWATIRVIPAINEF